MEKVKKSIWLSKESITHIENGMNLDDSRYINEYIENAVNYYTSYLYSDSQKDAMLEIFVKIFEGKLKGTENRISNLLFKNAVEQAKVNRILAYISEIDDDTLNDLQRVCVEEVKKTNGKLTLERVYKQVNSEVE